MDYMGFRFPGGSFLESPWGLATGDPPGQAPIATNYPVLGVADRDDGPRAEGFAALPPRALAGHATTIARHSGAKKKERKTKAGKPKNAEPPNKKNLQLFLLLLLPFPFSLFPSSSTYRSS